MAEETKTETRRPRPVRRIFRVLGWTLLALVLLILATLASAFGMLQTGWGKREIASLASGALSGEGKTAEFTGIEGFLPFDIRVERVRLGDPQGDWLEIDGARFHLVLSALLHRKVEIAAVGAERVALNRLPPSAPTPEPPEPFTFPSLPELPKSLPVAVDVLRIFVDRLELGQPVIGQAAAFRIDGHTRTNEAADRLTADLRIDRFDQATADIRLALDADLAGGALDLSLKANETGGLLAAVSERPEAGELHLDLGGQGPLADWRGRLALEAQHLASLETDLELGLADLPRIGIDGRLDMAPGVLPPEVEPLIGRTIDLTVRLRPTSPQQVELQALHLGAAGFALEARGEGNLAADTVDGSATLVVPDLAVASGLAKAPLEGRAALRLAATGALRQPVVNLTLDAGGLGYTTYGVRQLAVALQAKLLAPFETTFPGATLTGNASVGGREHGRQAAGIGRAARHALDARPGGDSTGARTDRHPESPPAGAGGASQPRWPVRPRAHGWPAAARSRRPGAAAAGGGGNPRPNLPTADRRQDRPRIRHHDRRGSGKDRRRPGAANGGFAGSAARRCRAAGPGAATRP